MENCLIADCVDTYQDDVYQRITAKRGLLDMLQDFRVSVKNKSDLEVAYDLIKRAEDMIIYASTEEEEVLNAKIVTCIKFLLSEKVVF